MDTIDYFFSGVFERTINRSMMYREYKVPREKILNYIQLINDAPIEEILKYICEQIPSETICAKDIFQISNLEDGTIRICALLKDTGDPGYARADIGKLLLDDGAERKRTAYIKYGENHSNLAYAFGLLQKWDDMYFLSCLGYVLPSLEENEREKILVRLLLRTKLIRQLWKMNTQCDAIIMRDVFVSLSLSTYKRRRSSLRLVLRILEDDKEYDFKKFINKLVFL